MTTIRVSRETKGKLEKLGRKGQSFDDIIMSLIHQRNILAIHEICKDMETDSFTKSTVLQVFDYIGYEIPPAPDTPNMNGETWYTHHSYEEAQRLYQNLVLELATDEDFVGSCRDNIPVAEAITNTYCLFEDINAPTWSMGLRFKNPFDRL